MSSKNHQTSSSPLAPEHILDASSRGKLVLFIGAGVSRIIGGPSWEDFANFLLDDLCGKKKINFIEKIELSKLQARKTLSICSDIYREHNIQFPNLKEFFKAKPQLKERFKIIEDLYTMNAIYVTTNYDDHLDEKAEKGRPLGDAYPSGDVVGERADSKVEKSKVFYKEEEILISNLSNGNVIHIHGSIKEPRTMIITLADYMNRYNEQKSRLPVFLREVFDNYTVLFVGYGLEEYEILEFMVNKIRRDASSISHYILLPFFDSQRNLVNLQKKYYQSMGIELIAYYIDDAGYPQLNEVIQEWAKQISPIAKPQTFLDKLRLIDEVL